MPEISDGELVIAVIQTRMRSGGCSQQDLADAVGMSKAGIRYRVHQLAAAGILDTTKAGDIRPCEPTVTIEFEITMHGSMEPNERKLALEIRSVDPVF